MKLVLLMILLMSSASGQLTDEENHQLDALVDKNIVFEYDEISDESISRVMDASIIGVKIFNLFEKDCHSQADCGHYNYSVLKSGDTFIELAGSDVILPYISPAFKLKSKVEAKEFEEMLDVLFPVFFSSGKEIYSEGNTWFFIREESFGVKKAIVVQVNGNGTILNIEDSEVE